MPLGAARSADDAGAFLLAVGKDAVQQLRDESLSKIEREERFRVLLNEAVDLKAISRFVLGANWRRASPQEQADFQSALEEMALQRFLPIFLRQDEAFDGDSFNIIEVRQSKKNPAHHFVVTKVGRDGGPDAKLTWRIGQKEETFKILDISVEGISMALTLREEFASAVRRYGGIQPMIKELQKKIESGAFKPGRSVN